MSHSIAELTDSLARYLPPGRIYAAANIQNTSFRRLLEGLSVEIGRVEDIVSDIRGGTVPDSQLLCIAEWESALGLPDECFTETDTLTDAERRTQITLKLASLGVQTAQDFVDLAAVFGVTATVRSASGVSPFPLTQPEFMPDPTATEARFIILIKMIYPPAVHTWNWVWTLGVHPWSDQALDTLKCLLERLRPANCIILYETTGAV